MSERLVAMTFEEASRWIASQDRRIAALEAALRNLIHWTYDEHTIGINASAERNKAIERAKDALATSETEAKP